MKAGSTDADVDWPVGTSVSAALNRIARETFGYESLRPEQERVVRSLLQGRDTLGVLPTGSGKSAIYQITGVLKGGYTVVVSPLIALQKDQVDSIADTRLPDAAVLNSGLRAGEREAAFERLHDGTLEYLLLAPEQLLSRRTLDAIVARPPSLFVVDEAHCMSEWGHDFRPDYARLGKVVDALGRPLTLALTATASPQVRQDIVARLGLRDPNVIVTGFDRPNIHLAVEPCPDVATKDRLLPDRVREAGLPGIVYVATRRHAEEVASRLRENNLAAGFYHGGMNRDDRDAAQESFMRDDAGEDLVVATNAFGMGVDKPDVRSVIHYDAPDSLDGYHQEVGRAGRDGDSSRTLLLYRPEDLGMRRALGAGMRVRPEDVQAVLREVRRAKAIDSDDLRPLVLIDTDAEDVREDASADAPADATKAISEGKLALILDLLERGGHVTVDVYGHARATGRTPAAKAAEKAVADQEAYRAYRQARIDQLKEYAETADCRRCFLLRYFGEADIEPCGHCDNCDSGAVERCAAERQRAAERGEEPFPVRGRVRHRAFGEGTVMRYEGDKVVVLFESVGYKEIVTSFAEQNGLMEVLS